MAADIRTPEDEALTLPVGMMIVGRWWDECSVLRAGDAFEQSVDWKSLHY